MVNIGNFQVTTEDYQRIKKFAADSGRPLGSIYRDAVLEYIDKKEQVEDDEYFRRRMKERDRDIVEGLKSMENRFAVLLVRLGIDLESLYALAWSLTSGREDRHEMFEKCYAVGVDRFRRRLSGLQREMADSLQHQGDTIKPAKKKGKLKVAKPPQPDDED
ncbi:MAG: hypothetical protein K2X81_13345 [Candidatus Obscuribacterales bacterium]|nr:hypothetical protein [Candidatus Obscuribacterales bacterium]